MEYKIEKGIDFPNKTARYPLSAMEVRDSFAFPREEIKNVRAYSGNYGKRAGKKFSTRAITFSEGRCWRIK